MGRKQERKQLAKQRQKESKELQTKSNKNLYDIFLSKKKYSSELVFTEEIDVNNNCQEQKDIPKVIVGGAKPETNLEKRIAAQIKKHREDQTRDDGRTLCYKVPHERVGHMMGKMKRNKLLFEKLTNCNLEISGTTNKHQIVKISRNDLYELDFRMDIPETRRIRCLMISLVYGGFIKWFSDEEYGALTNAGREDALWGKLKKSTNALGYDLISFDCYQKADAKRFAVCILPRSPDVANVKRFHDDLRQIGNEIIHARFRGQRLGENVLNDVKRFEVPQKIDCVELMFRECIIRDDILHFYLERSRCTEMKGSKIDIISIFENLTRCDIKILKYNRKYRILEVCSRRKQLNFSQNTPMSRQIRRMLFCFISCGFVKYVSRELYITLTKSEIWQKLEMKINSRGYELGCIANNEKQNVGFYLVPRAYEPVMLHWSYFEIRQLKMEIQDVYKAVKRRPRVIRMEEAFELTVNEILKVDPAIRSVE